MNSKGNEFQLVQQEEPLVTLFNKKIYAAKLKLKMK